MLRYDRQTKPGLVTLYDIRPGKAAGLFLQPRSLHGAEGRTKYIVHGRGQTHDKTKENNTLKRRTHRSTLWPDLCGDNLLDTNRHPQAKLYLIVVLVKLSVLAK